MAAVVDPLDEKPISRTQNGLLDAIDIEQFIVGVECVRARFCVRSIW